MTDEKQNSLNLFFEPRSVAVYGSMKEPLGEGITVIRNMLAFGFRGGIYPIINPLIDCGVDILNPVQVTAKGMDPVRLKKEFGDLW